MSEKFVLVSGDTAVFQASFGAATVSVSPGKIEGTSVATIDGKRVCVKDDERSVSVENCAYVTSLGHVGGSGTLSIASLASDQISSMSDVDGKRMLRVGSVFEAKFTVDKPATIPGSTPTVDPTASYSGRGSFETRNKLARVD